MNCLVTRSYTVEHYLVIWTGWDQRVSMQITGMKTLLLQVAIITCVVYSLSVLWI